MQQFSFDECSLHVSEHMRNRDMNVWFLPNDSYEDNF